MEREWEPYLTPLPIEVEQGSVVGANFVAAQRLDTLLPADPETGVVQQNAFHAYLGAMMEMAARHGQQLSLLNIGAENGKLLRFLGTDGTALIGRAIGRYLHQETRVHDVVGRLEDVDGSAIPTFLIAVLLMDEDQVAPLAERLRESMMAHAGGSDQPALDFSIGIATMSVDAGTPSELIARAAAALRQARLAGGGQVWRHSDSVRRIFERQSEELREEE